MKKRGYKVIIGSDRVSVEHRAAFRPRTIALLCTGYFCYLLIPSNRSLLVDVYRARDLVAAGFLFVLSLIPLLSGATWLFFASGEVMRCDAHELHFAKRRTWGRWHRSRFSSRTVWELRRVSRGGNKSRYYTVLTFQVDGRSFDILEDLTSVDCDAILQACKSMGLDTLIPVDTAAAMNRDIDERG